MKSAEPPKVQQDKDAALKTLLIAADRSCVPCTPSHTDLESIRREYPTLLHLDDGSLWFSRLPEGDNRIATDYESAYGWYVPGDPKEALSAVILCCRPEDRGVARDYIERFNALPSERS